MISGVCETNGQDMKGSTSLQTDKRFLGLLSACCLTVDWRMDGLPFDLPFPR